MQIERTYSHETEDWQNELISLLADIIVAAGLTEDPDPILHEPHGD